MIIILLILAVHYLHMEEVSFFLLYLGELIHAEDVFISFVIR